MPCDCGVCQECNWARTHFDELNQPVSCDGIVEEGVCSCARKANIERDEFWHERMVESVTAFDNDYQQLKRERDFALESLTVDACGGTRLMNLSRAIQLVVDQHDSQSDDPCRETIIKQLHEAINRWGDR